MAAAYRPGAEPTQWTARAASGLPPAGPGRGWPPAGIRLSLRPDPGAAGCPLVARTLLRAGSSEPAPGGHGGLTRAAEVRGPGQTDAESAERARPAPQVPPQAAVCSPTEGRPGTPKPRFWREALAPALLHLAQQAGGASLPMPGQKEEGETGLGGSLPDLKFYGLKTHLRPGNGAGDTEDQGFPA